MLLKEKFISWQFSTATWKSSDEGLRVSWNVLLQYTGQCQKRTLLSTWKSSGKFYSVLLRARKLKTVVLISILYKFQQTFLWQISCALRSRIPIVTVKLISGWYGTLFAQELHLVFGICVNVDVPRRWGKSD